MNPHLIRLIDYVHENSGILKLLPINLNDILDHRDLAVLDAFDTLILLAKYRLRITAIKQLEREKYIHKLNHDVKSMLASIESK